MLQTRGYVATKASAPFVPYSFERRDPRPQDVVIDIQYCGICHTDIHQVQNDWGGSIYPMVPGHEITGIVSAIGSQVTRYKVGDRVGVGCFVDSCRHCGPCLKGMEQYCSEGTVFTYNSRDRDGTITMGGYSDRIVVDENYVLHIPDGLPLDGAAPLLCAGITLFSPLKYWHAGPEKNVAIIGLGGLGHMGVKLAHAMGAKVTVLSHSTRKQQDAKRLGADYFYDTSEPETFRKLKATFDLIINTVSAPMDLQPYLDLLKVEGNLVLLGAPKEPVPISARALISGHKAIAGSMIGGIHETQQALDFCGEHSIVSDIEVIPIQTIDEAYKRMLRSDVRYRFVIDMASLKANG